MCVYYINDHGSVGYSVTSDLCRAEHLRFEPHSDLKRLLVNRAQLVFTQSQAQWLMGMDKER